MDWQHDPDDDSYTLIQGDVRCRVWHTTFATWAAVFVHHGISSAADTFERPAAPHAWCEAQARGSTCK